MEDFLDAIKGLMQRDLAFRANASTLGITITGVL